MALHSKGQGIDPWRQQLEKVVYLDENPWTHKKLKNFMHMADWLERTLNDNESLFVERHTVQSRFSDTFGLSEKCH